MTTAVTPVQIEGLVYRAPIRTPLRTSFGTMHDRPCVLVRVTDSNGAMGWGEAWCNWPTVAAEYRARLINEIIAPALVGRSFEDPAAAFFETQARLEMLAIQTGDVGPLAQALAGIDIALWDLAARKADVPLCALLGGARLDTVPAYASGLNPDNPEKLARERFEQGHRAFKLKIGFGRERDLHNLAALRETLGDDVILCVDANMAYDLETAIAMSEDMARFNLHWYEEPIRADASADDWHQLARRSPLRIAAGENLRGRQLYEAIEAGDLGVIQPDVSKWGGISGNLPVARAAVEAGRTFCPHWLAGGIGQLASLHLLAAVGGDGLLEYDANPNPLRSQIADDHLELVDGRVHIPESSGLGVIPDLGKLATFAVGLT